MGRTTVDRRVTTVERSLTMGRRGLTVGRTTPVPMLMGRTRGDSGACNSKGGCDKRER